MFIFLQNIISKVKKKDIFHYIIHGFFDKETSFQSIKICSLQDCYIGSQYVQGNCVCLGHVNP